MLCAALVAAALLTAGPARAGDPLRPDPHLTPGATFPVSAAEVCRRGYASSVRHVDSSTKAAVYREYGIPTHRPGTYEVDHLISLELGGSNDIANLWPESYVTLPWNAHVKDRLENRLHALVCAGAISLQNAQRAISGDWIAAYGKYIGQP